MSLPHSSTPPTGAAHAASSAPPNMSATGQDLIPACHSNQDHPGLRFAREMSGPVADARDNRPVTAKEPATSMRPGQGDTDPTGRPYRYISPGRTNIHTAGAGVTNRNRKRDEVKKFIEEVTVLIMSSQTVQQNYRKNSAQLTSTTPVVSSTHNKFNYSTSNPSAGRGNNGRYGNDSFSDYERTTIDAWDAKDDDLSVSTSSTLSFRDDSKFSSVPSTKTSQIASVSASSKHGLNANGDIPSTAVRVAESNGVDAKGSSGNKPRRVSGNNTKQEHVSNSASLPCSPAKNLPVENCRRERFEQMLSDNTILNLSSLRSICWNGIPSDYRPAAWKILCGYMPTAPDRREAAVERKRCEYHGFVERYFNVEKFADDNEMYHQICTDVPRMSPLVALFQQSLVRHMFERILYIWAVRHPGSGYVQGINDLVTPYFLVYLGEYVPQGQAVDKFEVSTLSESCRRQLEADCFWCFSYLLDSIHDSYTFAQPGIQRSVSALGALVRRIDSGLHAHLQSNSVDYLQFSFRWMNNLLTRELPLRCVVRLWDTYLSEPPGDFATFHVYVCASFLTRFSPQLRVEHDFHGLMTLLQNLPTRRWTENEISLLLAEAYRLRFTFEGAPNHLISSSASHTSQQRTTKQQQHR